MSAVYRSRIVSAVVAVLALLGALLGAVVLAPAANAAIVTPFTPRFDKDLAGSVRLIGNTSMTCSTTSGANAAKCITARDGSGPALNNNAFVGENVDVDGDSSTFNSSRANLAMPAGATVVRADLFWGAKLNRGTAPPNPGAKNTVKFKTEINAPYENVTADTVSQFNNGASGLSYSAVANVTSLVKAADNGTYSVGNVQASTGATDLNAGWSLIVVYAAASEPVRSITVFSGFADVVNNAKVDIPLTGFRTPPDGKVKSQIGLVSYEGDRQLVGDTLSIIREGSNTEQQLSDGSRPPTNFFNSFINEPPGTPVTNKTPNYNNQLGFDIGRIDASGKLGNNDTSATLRATTTGDAYYPSAFTFETELYTPKMVPIKTAVDLNGGKLKAGDTVRYTVTAQNDGDDGGTNAKLVDTLPPNATYVPGSAKLNNAPATASVTNGVLSLNIGNVTAGGLPGSGPFKMTYDVVVNNDVVGGDHVINKPKITITAITGNRPLEFPGNEVDLLIADQQADLTLQKTAASTMTAGKTGTFTLRLGNSGPDTASGQLKVEDTLPAGQEFVSATGTGWSCSASGQKITCTNPADIANGATAPPITVKVAVPSTTDDAEVQTNTATGTSTTPDPGGSPVAEKEVTIERHHDLVMNKTHAGNVVPGTNATFSLGVSNKGPSSAGSVPGKPVTMTDTLPAGLSFVSATGTGWTCNAAGQLVTCTYAEELEAGGVAPAISLVAKVDAAKGNFANTASVATTDGTEDHPSDNTDTDNVTVTPQVDGAITMTGSGTPTKGGAPVGVLAQSINFGPSAIKSGTKVTTTFKIPAKANLTGLGATGSWNCTPTSGPGAIEVTCDQTLAADVGPGGDFDNITLQVSLDGDAPDSNIVQGNIEVPGDVDAANNDAEVDLGALVDADIQITTAADLTLVAGGPAKGATLTVKNNGPSTDPGKFTVSIPVPADLDIKAAAGSPWNCATATGLLTCTLTGTSLATGESNDLKLDVSAPDPSTKPQSNQLDANVTSPADDSDLSNNETAFPVTVVAEADLEALKTADPAAIKAGQSVTFTLGIKNWGASEAGKSALSDTLPAGFTVTSVTPDSGVNCTNSDVEVDCTVDSLAVNATKNVVVVAKSDSGMTPGTKTNTNKVSGETPEGSGDKPNTKDADVAVTQFSKIDLAKALVADSGNQCSASGNEPVTAGRNVCYELTATNKGPSVSGGITITDTLPGSLSFLSAQGEDWTCTDPVVTCSYNKDVALDASPPPLKVVAYLSSTATGSLTNNATGTPNTPGAPGEAEKQNNIIPMIDLQLTHTTNQSSVDAGQDWTSEITVQNNGPSDEPGEVKVETTLSDGQDFKSATGTGWNCSYAKPKVTCTYPAGAKNGDVLPTITLVTTPDSDATSVQAQSTATGTIEDEDLNNNTDATNSQIVGSADLAIVKSVSGSSNVKTGQLVTFKLQVTNHGPSSAPSTRVTDQLPAGVAFSSKTPPPCGMGDSGTAIVCDVANLKPGASVAFTILATVTAKKGTITNVATVTSSNRDPKPQNNTGKTTITVIPPKDKPQVPVTKPPTKIKNTGKTVIFKKTPRTNAGQNAKVTVTCRPVSRALAPRGDVTFCKVIKGKNGMITISIQGKDKVKVTVRMTSKKVPGYTSMNVTYSYITSASGKGSAKRKG